MRQILGMLVMLCVGDIAAAAAPLLQPQSWAVQAGKPVEVRAADAAPGATVRFVARLRGSQRIVDAEPLVAGQPAQWRYTPEATGTVIFSAALEPAADAKPPKTFRYEKLFLRVSAADGSKSPPEPSASAMARFGQRFEL